MDDEAVVVGQVGPWEIMYYDDGPEDRHFTIVNPGTGYESDFNACDSPTDAVVGARELIARLGWENGEDEEE